MQLLLQTPAAIPAPAAAESPAPEATGCECSAFTRTGSARAAADLIEARAIVDALSEAGVPASCLSAAISGDSGKAEVRILTARSGLIVLVIPARQDAFTLWYRRRNPLPLVERRRVRAQPARVARAVLHALRTSNMP